MNIIVDGYCLGNPGQSGYKGVNLDNYEIVFEEHLGTGTNNIAEFLAICHALHYLKKRNLPLKVTSDSQTAIAWVTKKKANTTFNGDIAGRIKDAERFLKTLDKYELIKGDTRKLGENPADFGNKK